MLLPLLMVPLLILGTSVSRLPTLTEDQQPSQNLVQSSVLDWDHWGTWSCGLSNDRAVGLSSLRSHDETSPTAEAAATKVLNLSGVRLLLLLFWSNLVWWILQTHTHYWFCSSRKLSTYGKEMGLGQWQKPDSKSFVPVSKPFHHFCAPLLCLYLYHVHHTHIHSTCTYMKFYVQFLHIFTHTCTLATFFTYLFSTEAAHLTNEQWKQLPDTPAGKS